MRMFGLLYYTRKPGETGALNYKHRRLEMYSKVAHIILGCTLWLNFVRYFSAYDASDSLNAELMRKLVVHGYFLHVAAAFVTCSNASRMWRHVFNQWHAYRTQHPVTGSVTVNTRRRINMFISLLGILYGTNIVLGILYFVFYPSSAKYFNLLQLFIEPLPKYLENTKGPEIFAMVFNIILFSVLFIPFGFIILHMSWFTRRISRFQSPLPGRNELQKRPTRECRRVNRIHYRVLQVNTHSPQSLWLGIAWNKSQSIKSRLKYYG